jgi:hypothetical protein
MPARRIELALAVVVAAAAAILLLRPGEEEPESPPVAAPPAAGAFADSIGVNVHLTYDNTPYADFDRVLASLRELGVRHVRDGLVPSRPDQYERLDRLASAGIRSTLIMGAPNATRVSDLVATLKGPLLRAAEAVEGPNEYDLSGDPRWADALRGYQRELYAAVRREPALRDLPVYGPTVVKPENRSAVRDLREALDAANLHPYPAGQAPEPAVDREITAARELAGRKPVVATETGYHNALNAREGQPPVDEATAADYLPRLFLTAFARGIRRTYWYELVDAFPDDARGTADANFGLLRHDFAPKPAFVALANLLRLAGDPGAPEAPRRPLDLSIAAPRGGVRRLVLQKGDGAYLLALWSERPLDVRVRLPRAAREVALHRPSRSAHPSRQLRDVDVVRVPLGSDATIVEIRFDEA